MKYTNIKKLLIKFMGGGLINFPTRFLRWIKIDGDTEGDDDGGGSGGDDSGGSTEIDYEAIYQFYKNKFIKTIPEEYIEQVIIPEHLNDVQYGIGSNKEYMGKLGIWKINNGSINRTGGNINILHAIGVDSESITEVIYFGPYSEGGETA